MRAETFYDLPMILGRFVGWIVLLAGLAALLRDLLVLVDTGHWLPLALGEAPREIDPFHDAGLISAFPAFAAPLWAWPVLTVLGLILLALFRRRPARRRR
jgi:hypothetical protein